MKSNSLSTNFSLAMSVCFTLLLVIIRAFITSQFIYVFYVWNLFLAIVPISISNKLLVQKTKSFKAGILFFSWLIFFPNAPYIVTDLFHFAKRDNIPLWFDLLIVTTAAWNGLILGFVSLLNVEQFLKKQFEHKKANAIIWISIFLCGFGVYLGRFLRFNSWDVFNNADDLIMEISSRFIHPFQHINTWCFSFLFALMIGLFYFTLKSFSKKLKINLE